MNNIFGPMSVNYCNIFLGLSAFYLLFTVLMAGSFLFSLTNKKVSLMIKIRLLIDSVTFLLLYIAHRIFYNMCVKTA